MSFESLDVWKQSARLSADLYRSLSNLKDWGFRDQITRSGLSIPSNIAEGFERDGDPEIARLLTFPKGSAGELITQIYIGIEAGYIEKQQSMAWVREAKELSRMLGALINKHRQRRTKNND